MAKQQRNEMLAASRMVHDLAVALVTSIEEADGTNEDVRRIFKDETLKKRLGLLVMGKLKLGGFPCEKNVPHLIPEGSEVIEDVEATEFDSTKLKFPGFLQDNESSVGGETMRERAKEMPANFGLSDVPALLGEDGKGLETIPAELRGEYIVLAGTLLRRSFGDLYVPSLSWDGDGWYLGFDWLVDGWGDDGRLVSCE